LHVPSTKKRDLHNTTVAIAGIDPSFERSSVTRVYSIDLEDSIKKDSHACGSPGKPIYIYFWETSPLLIRDPEWLALVDSQTVNIYPRRTVNGRAMEYILFHGC